MQGSEQIPKAMHLEMGLSVFPKRFDEVLAEREALGILRHVVVERSSLPDRRSLILKPGDLLLEIPDEQLLALLPTLSAEALERLTALHLQAELALADPGGGLGLRRRGQGWWSVAGRCTQWHCNTMPLREPLAVGSIGGLQPARGAHQRIRGGQKVGL